MSALNYYSSANKITYPIAFNKAVLAIIATPKGTNSESGIYSQFSVETQNINNCVLRNYHNGTVSGGYVIVCGN